MEGRKSNKGLVICLIILLLAFICISVLLGMGIVKSPFVKCDDCKDTVVTDNTKNDSNEKVVKETRYYQYCSDTYQEIDSSGNPIYKCSEIELSKDGTAKIAYRGVNDMNDKTGIYVEDDKYIVLALNTDSSECREGNYAPQIADVCKDSILLTKSGNLLKTQTGTIFHFELDDSVIVRDYKEISKSDLLTSLKN